MRKGRGSALTVRPPARMGFGDGLARLLCDARLDDGFWARLESQLIASDAGLAVTEHLISRARAERTPAMVKHRLAEEMVGMLRSARPPVLSRPHVVLVMGVNGVGKTTTIAKLARSHIDEGRRVLLVACDTFRAAASEQLAEWGKRLRCEVVAQRPGADPAAVAHDGVSKAAARGHDVVIVDTAGRLHTRQNLMEELRKISRVLAKACPGAPHEKLIVIDATVGGNGLVQAREFHAAVGLTGAVVAKLDGTAKGGVLLAISRDLGVPIRHVGTGEGMRDLKPFDAREFVESILSCE
ncbi:MAG: signal recognition particle-docking protein FtsY [Proteobacteria bacterium]|nr:signal recognition particle-docking protein FtsY [Pseudomonadota bacterium]